MTDDDQDAGKAFARNLFAPDDNVDQDDDEQDRQVTAHDDGLDAERQFVGNLFAPEDPAAPVFAGLTSRTVGRTTAPRPGPVPKNEFRFS